MVAGRDRAAAGGSGGPQPSVGSQAFSITYQQVEQWPGGFADQITIRGLSGTRAQTWSLAFGYPGARSQASRARLGAGPGPGPGWRRACRGPAGGRRTAAAAVRLMVIVEGRPAAPSGCAFDGQLCTFGSPATP